MTQHVHYKSEILRAWAGIEHISHYALGYGNRCAGYRSAANKVEDALSELADHQKREVETWKNKYNESCQNYDRTRRNGRTLSRENAILKKRIAAAESWAKFCTERIDKGSDWGKMGLKLTSGARMLQAKKKRKRLKKEREEDTKHKQTVDALQDASEALTNKEGMSDDVMLDVQNYLRDTFKAEEERYRSLKRQRQN